MKICVKCMRIIQEEADQCPDCQGSGFKEMEIVPPWLRELEKEHGNTQSCEEGLSLIHI